MPTIETPAPDVEVWPVSENVTRRQVEEWSEDEDNASLYRAPVDERRRLLRAKAEVLGWHHSAWYFRRLGVPPRGRILELGAGCFWLSTYLSSLAEVREVVGVELSRDRLLAFRDVALDLFPGSDRRKIRYVVGDMHRINAPDESFDIVTSDSVLHHADNLVRVLREAWRVLRPGGWYVAVREPTISRFRLRPPRFHARYPEDGSAMYYYAQGWQSAFLNAWFANVRMCHHVAYGRVRGRRIPWPVRRLLRAVDLRVHLRAYPKVCIAAQKPREQ
jgi:ubiquinone/menaquinone biosynthesis C-methylase UbiE